MKIHTLFSTGNPLQKYARSNLKTHLIMIRSAFREDGVHNAKYLLNPINMWIMCAFGRITQKQLFSLSLIPHVKHCSTLYTLNEHKTTNDFRLNFTPDEILEKFVHLAIDPDLHNAMEFEQKYKDISEPLIPKEKVEPFHSLTERIDKDLMTPEENKSFETAIVLCCCPVFFELIEEDIYTLSTPSEKAAILFKKYGEFADFVLSAAVLGSLIYFAYNYKKTF